MGLAAPGLLPAAGFAAVVCLGCGARVAALWAAAVCAALAAAAALAATAMPCANWSVLEACRPDDFELPDEAVNEGGRILSATCHHPKRPGAR